MSKNYPPGVTGNEPEIAGDEAWERFHENIDKDATREGMSDADATVAWWLGLAAYKEARKLGVKFSHD